MNPIYIHRHQILRRILASTLSVEMADSTVVRDELDEFETTDFDDEFGKDNDELGNVLFCGDPSIQNTLPFTLFLSKMFVN